MNLTFINGTKSYVDIEPSTPVYHIDTSKSTILWPTPRAETWIGQHPFHHTTHIVSSSEQTRGLERGVATRSSIEDVVAQESAPFLSSQSPHLNTQTVVERSNHLGQQNSSLPPVLPSQQLKSTPSTTQSPPLSSTASAQGLFTPPDSAVLVRQQAHIPLSNTMADPRRVSGGQRQMMGPPETPSRVMQASPNLFPSLQFSPDLFSTHNMGPMTAPIYPQQRLFWDPSAPPVQEQHHTQQYSNMYQDNLHNSFSSSNTVVPSFSPMIPQDPQYDLPLQNHTVSPFLDNTAFPAPFQTSPRPLPSSNENPTLFLSSPARRFGGVEAPVPVYPRRPVREVPAYHHQIEESRREMEVERERRRKASKRADDELIMSSVKRALSPSKTLRPGLKRSNTHSGITVDDSRFRRQGRASFNDSGSTASVVSNLSGRTGRSSPLKQTSFASAMRSKAFQKPRASMSLAIDENGVAKTILEELPESDDEMDMDNDSQSLASSTDEDDLHVIHSQSGSFAMNDNDEPLGRPSNFRKRDPSHTLMAKKINHPSSSSASSVSTDQRRYQGDTIRQPKRASSMRVDTSDRYGSGDAQKALLAVIQDRSRSASTQDDYPSSRHSDSSHQFHSSPPIHQNQFGNFNASPTTITDPELATPSTDQDSLGGSAIMRCVCSSNSPDGSAALQCDSCSRWLHANCVGVNPQRMPQVYVCVYCEQTPVRHTAHRGSQRNVHRGSSQNQNASPLAHKSSRPQRTR